MASKKGRSTLSKCQEAQVERCNSHERARHPERIQNSPEPVPMPTELHDIHIRPAPTRARSAGEGSRHQSGRPRQGQLPRGPKLQRGAREEQSIPQPLSKKKSKTSNQLLIASQETFADLVKGFAPSSVLIVSNSSGLRSKDPDGLRAGELERATGVEVLRHDEPKPAPSCADAVLKHFGGIEPARVVVVGDRLFTDVVMANAMGSRSVWVRQGVVPDRGFVTRLECWMYGFLLRRGFRPPER